MVSLIGWVCVGVGVLVALGWLVSWIRSKWPSAVPSSVASVVDKVSDYVDEGSAGAALGTAALLFKKHGDTEAVTQLGILWGKAMAWPDEPAAVAATTAAATPTVEQLAAKVAALEGAAPKTQGATP